MGLVSLGVAFGVIVTLIVVAAIHSSNKRNKQRRSVHLSPQIYFNNPTPEPEQEVRNASFRTSPTSPRKVAFEPMPAGF